MRVNISDSGNERLPRLHYHAIKLYLFNFLISTAVVECYDECLAVETLDLQLLGSTVRASIIVLSMFSLNALTSEYPVVCSFLIVF